MKKLSHIKVLLFAAGIILACTAALIISVHVAFGAEENKAAAGENQPAPVAGSAGTGATPDVGAQYIAQEEAEEALAQIVDRLFDQTLDTSAMTAKFDDSGEHAVWFIEDAAFSCSIDALSGDVLYCGRTSEYSGDRITQSDYDNYIHDMLTFAPGNSVADMNNSPDNVYIKAALQFVNERLAEGRGVDNAMINAAQFIWEGRANSGIIEADVDVLMATGRSYRLVFWGVENPVLSAFYSFPSQHACLWGYSFEEDAPEEEWPPIWPEPTPTPAPNE